MTTSSLEMLGEKNLSIGACLFTKQHQLSGISKPAPFLLASASRAAPPAASHGDSHGDSRVSVLLLGLASLGGGRGPPRVWSGRDERTFKRRCSHVADTPQSRMFYLVAVILLHVVNGDHYQEPRAQGRSGFSRFPALPPSPGCRGASRQLGGSTPQQTAWAE